MICPACGCQQRETDACVQCHAPLFAKTVRDSDSESHQNLDFKFTEETHPSRMDADQASYQGTTEPPSAPSVRVASESESRPASPQPSPGPSNSTSESTRVLIATTQRIEGKRIATYFGVVAADALIASDETFSNLTPADSRKRFSMGTFQALKHLREEAIRLKANAVVATSFNYHRIDDKTILVSAVGTAVLLKAH